METAESVNNLEAMSQWVAFSRLRVPFHLYMPAACIDSTRRLCTELDVSLDELWAYHSIGDQMRFTLVQRSAQPEAKPARLWRAGPGARSRCARRTGGPAASRGRAHAATPAASRSTSGPSGGDTPCSRHRAGAAPRAPRRGAGGDHSPACGRQDQGRCRGATRGGQGATQGCRRALARAEAPVSCRVPFLRVIRDKRGYETTYLMHWYREGSRQRSAHSLRVPHAGRRARRPERARARTSCGQIEAQHPDIAFDWAVVRDNQQIVEPPPMEPRRRRADRAATRPSAPAAAGTGSAAAAPPPVAAVPAQAARSANPCGPSRATTPDEQIAFLAHWYPHAA